MLDKNGTPTGEFYTSHKTSGDARWLGILIQEELHCDEPRAKKIIKYWQLNASTTPLPNSIPNMVFFIRYRPEDRK